MVVVSRNPKTILMGIARGLDLDLPDGADSIFPNAEEKPGPDTPTPFIRVTQEDVANIDDIVQTVSWSFWVYDDAEQSYWRIDRIHKILKDSLDGLRLGDTALGVLDRMQREYLTGEVVDQDYNKLVKFARYRSWLV